MAHQFQVSQPYPDPEGPHRYQCALAQFLCVPLNHPKGNFRLPARREVHEPHDSVVWLAPQHGQLPEVLIQRDQDSLLCVSTRQYLLVSGVYYPVEVLPGWMQYISQLSPVTYALEGSRAALLEGAGVGQLWGSIWPLIIMGAVFVPLGLLIFRAGERYAKRTGKLKRSG